MASGKKNYFRHSFFARNDIKLRLLRDEVGVGFYFYYFTLLEQCGECCADEFRDEFEFHDSIIRQLWGVNLKKCQTIAIQMNAVGLLVFKKGDKTFDFTIPNLSKYLGKYETKTEPNTPNKRKEKKRKEKQNKENKSISFPVQQISVIWNQIVLEGTKLIPIKVFNEKRKIAAEAIIQEHLEMRTIEDWGNYFNKIAATPFLTGSNDKNWKASFDWVLNKNNFVKIIEGNYDDLNFKKNNTERLMDMENPFEDKDE